MFSEYHRECTALRAPHNFRADIQIDVLLAEVNSGLVAWPRRLLAMHDTTTASMPMTVPLVARTKRAAISTETQHDTA